MDDFGVLVERYGVKTGRNSAPMAASKNVAKPQKNFSSVNQDPNFFSKSTQNSNYGGGAIFNDQTDDIFGFNSSHKGQNHAGSDIFDDVFQVPTKSSSSSNKGVGFDFDMTESMFKGSMNLNANSSNANNVDDDIWGFSEKGSTNVNVNVVVDNTADLLTSDPVDDFWGKLERVGLDSRRIKRLEEDKGTNDDLIPGFGGSSTANDRSRTSTKEKNPAISPLDELQGFTRKKTDGGANGQKGGFTVKNEQKKSVNNKFQETNFFDIDGDDVPQEKMEEANVMFQAEGHDLDSFFGAHSRKSAPATGNTTMSTKSNEEPDLFTASTIGVNVKGPSRDFPDDFSSMFEAAPTPGVFEEIEGESGERRNLRFARHQRAEERMKQALAEMNQREFKAQQEQEERYRIAEAMDVEMKRWAAGKEGNLRALLSSLQQVLPSEFGWRPVTLTDLITSSQVKVAYKKATLCVHPDKVQQKGASLQQKYVAEKAFDLLKEAYNKFNKEELR